MHLSWTGNNLINYTSLNTTGRQLPIPTHKVQKSRQGRYSYYQNVCTVSYSMVWWTIDRWYQELDWMALSGINMPLAFIGQEIIWLDVFREIGLNNTDIREFLGGPAFMAWQRMGNIQKWGGPMPIDWINKQHNIQIKILQRARELGMIPILPAFGGFVPPQMKQLYPNANIVLSSKWLSFDKEYSPVHLVEVTDPLFQKIGTMFIQKLTDVYGTNHYYNADTFNEMDPSSGDLKYLTAASKAISSSIRSSDPRGVWVMQSWLFNSPFWTNERISAYLDGPPKDDENNGLLILDLASEQKPHYNTTNSYFGRPFIYSMLHNYGGNHGLYGKMQVISVEPPKLFNNSAESSNTTIAGIGLTMEGINQNYVVYDLMTEMAWRQESPNLEEWIKEYALRRYGLVDHNNNNSNNNSSSNSFIYLAWVQLLNTVYMCPTSLSHRGVTKSLAVKRPGMSILHDGFMPTELFYDADDLVIAWRYLLKAAAAHHHDNNTTHYSISETETYRYDLVDVTRQVLSNLLIPTYANMLKAFELKQMFDFQVYSTRFLDIMEDMDKIVSSNEHFLLERWLSSARSMADADDTDLANFYEFNARNQITLWGPKGEINDYASKQYGGLLLSYYKPRWELFFRYLRTALEASAEFDKDGFNVECLKLEQSWQHGTERYPYNPLGNSYKVALGLYEKYEDLFLSKW